MIAMPRLAFAAVFSGLALILLVVVLLLTDGLRPGRVSPGFAGAATALGGALLVLGLAGLERERDRSGEWG
jgi:hypothetical protein